MQPAEPCRPIWYDLNQLEFQFVNIRHTQHHAGQLVERIADTDPMTETVRWRGTATV